MNSVLEATLKVMRGDGAFERDAVVFDEEAFVWPTLAGLLTAASLDGGRLRVLDFGGSLGSTFFQHLPFLTLLREVRWNIVEQPRFVEVGRSHLENSELRFFDSISDALDDSPNAILVSGVLQFLEDPASVIRELSMIGANVLIMDRTPFSRDGGSFVAVQRVSDEIYPASYAMHVFDRPAFHSVIGESWRQLASSTSSVDVAHSRVGRHVISFEGGIFLAKS